VAKSWNWVVRAAHPAAPPAARSGTTTAMARTAPASDCDSNRLMVTSLERIGGATQPPAF